MLKICLRLIIGIKLSLNNLSFFFRLIVEVHFSIKQPLTYLD